MKGIGQIHNLAAVQRLSEQFCVSVWSVLLRCGTKVQASLGPSLPDEYLP